MAGGDPGMVYHGISCDDCTRQHVADHRYRNIDIDNVNKICVSLSNTFVSDK